MKGALTEEFHWCGVGHLKFSTQIFGKQAVGFPPQPQKLMAAAQVRLCGVILLDPHMIQTHESIPCRCNVFWYCTTKNSDACTALLTYCYCFLITYASRHFTSHSYVSTVDAATPTTNKDLVCWLYRRPPTAWQEKAIRGHRRVWRVLVCLTLDRWVQLMRPRRFILVADSWLKSRLVRPCLFSNFTACFEPSSHRALRRPPIVRGCPLLLDCLAPVQ